MSEATLEDLRAALDALDDDLVLPVGDLRQLPQAKRLFEVVDARIAARQYEYLPESDQAYGMVEEQHAQANGAAKTILMFCLLRRRDRIFLEDQTEDLTIFRADFAGLEPSYPEHELKLIRVGDGLVPQSTRTGEQHRLGILAELQAFVPSVEGSPATLEANERRVDDFGLIGGLAEHYRARVIRRVAWGSGSCLLTDQRLIGILFDDDVTGRPDTAESLNMPLSSVTGEVSSAVAFTAERNQFTSRQVSAGVSPLGKFFYNRVPTLNLHGSEFHAVIDVRRVVDPDGSIRKPRKDEVDSAVFEFCNSVAPT